MPKYDDIKKDLIFEWNAASKFDWPKIKHLFVEAYVSSYKNGDPAQFNWEGKILKEDYIIKLKSHFGHLFDEEKRAILAQEHNHQRIQYVIARLHDQPIAFFSCEVNQKSAKIYLRWVTLNPGFHQMGIGRAILNELGKHFPETCGMELYTRKINETSIAFYKKCGFEEVKEIEFDEPDLMKKTDKPILSQYVSRWLKNDAIFAPLDEKVPNIERFVGFKKGIR